MTVTREQIVTLLSHIRPADLTIYSAADAILALFAEQTTKLNEGEIAAQVILGENTRLTARVAELEMDISWIAKWIERGLFDPSTEGSMALKVISLSPIMPWATGRWNVDHLPYATWFYNKFPEALGGKS